MDLISRQIEARGFATSVHRMGDYVELRAVQLPAGDLVYIARVDGDSDHDVERATHELAVMCGVGWHRTGHVMNPDAANAGARNSARKVVGQLTGNVGGIGSNDEEIQSRDDGAAPCSA